MFMMVGPLERPTWALDPSTTQKKPQNFKLFQVKWNIRKYQVHIPCCQGITLGAWGLSLEYQLPQDVTDAVHSLEQMGTYVAGYVKTPPESSYGNNAFCVTLHNLLKSYADSRQCSLPKIHLKIGGTLWYRCEVCYVIIFCTKDDLKTLSKFKDITRHEDNGVLDPNGLVGQDGGGINPGAIPTFSPQHVVSWYGGTRKSISWEGIAFALYFPNGKSDTEVSHRNGWTERNKSSVLHINTTTHRSLGKEMGMSQFKLLHIKWEAIPTELKDFLC